MPTKTVYVPERHLHVWRRAEQLAGRRGMSKLVVALVLQHVERTEHLLKRRREQQTRRDRRRRGLVDRKAA